MSKDLKIIEEFSWRAHPAVERPKAALGALVIITAVAAAAWLSFGMMWALAAGFLLLASLNRFFLPSQFTIDAEGIAARHPLQRQRYRWSDLRRFVHDRHGGFLSTRAITSRLDGYSGMHILFGGHRAEVIEQIRARMHNLLQHSSTISPLQAPALRSRGRSWAG